MSEYPLRQRADRGWLGWGILGFVLLCAWPGALAAELRVVVRDADGAAVSDASVVVVTPGAHSAEPPRLEGGNPEIVQMDKAFAPLVSVVPVGTTVRFPNRDSVAHHVYSFSEAKKFDVPLYAGGTAPEVVFDKPGVVALGCNIHDWMRAYVVVSESPWYGLTGGDGVVVLKDVPEGPLTLQVWHPRLRGSAASHPVEAESGGQTEVVLKLRPETKPRRFSEGGSRGGYR